MKRRLFPAVLLLLAAWASPGAARTPRILIVGESWAATAAEAE